MCKSRSPWVGIILYSVLILAGIPKAFAGPHYVFAHYMVCFAAYGQTVDGYKQEIRDAQAAGIDGFALNVGDWNGPNWYYKTNVEMIYEAAESLTNGFKLFFSVDMPSTNTNDIMQMVSTYAKRTNSFYFDGKLVLSTYLGNGTDWTNSVLQPLKSQGINVFFIPGFSTEGGTWQQLPQYAIALVTKYGSFIDGLFDFLPGLPSDIIFADNAYLQACRGAGKLSMVAYSPTYWGCIQPSAGRRYFESEGGPGIITQWQWIITNQPDWVEILTWNDLNESTYILPLSQPGHYDSSPPQRFSHAGYLALMAHYISWYKSGVEPEITRDGLFCFYRTHPTNAVASNTSDIPVTQFLGPVQDAIYATTTLTAPADLQIKSGNYTTNLSLPSGISSLQIRFQPGAQNLILRRKGKQVAAVSGPEIVTNIQYYDYFVASSYDYAISAPTNLRVAK